MTLLPNTHISAETAYVVDDYPYGFRLRCSIRYWLEFRPKHGFRLVSQTTNPKKAGTVWNKPKAGTYSRFGGAMFLDAEGHVHGAGLTEYSTYAEAQAWSDKYRAAVPEAGLKTLDFWVKAKKLYEKATADKVAPVEADAAAEALVGAVIADTFPADQFNTV
jgi:hypothetical protein